ncbi:Villin-2, partial [Trifolium medium]|nr:Villin-2 [Trifolium medium]
SGIDEAESEIDEADSASNGGLESEQENVEDGNNDQSSQMTFSYDQLKTTSGNDVSGI